MESRVGFLFVAHVQFLLPHFNLSLFHLIWDGLRNHQSKPCLSSHAHQTHPFDLRFFQSSPFNGDDPWLKMTLVRLLSKQEMGVSKNRGTPKWMVYHGKLIKMDDLGVPLFLETPKWWSPFSRRHAPSWLPIFLTFLRFSVVVVPQPFLCLCLNHDSQLGILMGSQ